MSQTKESFVVQAKRAGARAYADAGAGKSNEDKAREALAAAQAKEPEAKFRLVRRTTSFTHVDTPLKSKSK